jgi:TonB family protein
MGRLLTHLFCSTPIRFRGGMIPRQIKRRSTPYPRAMSKRFFSLAFLSVACAAVLPAQQASIFLVKTDDGKFYPVARVNAFTPQVMVNGKFHPVTVIKQVMLKGAPAFGDGYINFRDFRITTYLDPSGDQDDNFFSIKGSVSSDRALQDCFLLIEFAPAPGSGPTPMVVEMPDLPVGEFKSISCRVRQQPGSDFEDRVYKLHFFSGTSEHITSLMTESAQAEAAKNTDSEVLKRTESRKLSVLVPIRAKRPAGLPDDLAGSATIHCRVGTDGQILEASILKATNPEFGQSAFDAVQQWIFVPAIKNHEYVETQVNVPIIFDAPSPAPAAAK